jgi:hypothetical protein
MLLDLCERRPLALTRSDDGGDGLAPTLVGGPTDDGIDDRRVAAYC